MIKGKAATMEHEWLREKKLKEKRGGGTMKKKVAKA